jgi:hypothetical protein
VFKWFAAILGAAFVGWRGRVWLKARAKRSINAGAVSEQWVAQQRGAHERG